MKEEQILFPFVFRMEEAAAANEPAPLAMFGTVANPVRVMMQEHDGAGEALRKLRGSGRRVHQLQGAVRPPKGFRG
jgi:iron-sulfur cluster repair protein YtfE (RIC family)